MGKGRCRRGEEVTAVATIKLMAVDDEFDRLRAHGEIFEGIRFVAAMDEMAGVVAVRADGQRRGRHERQADRIARPILGKKKPQDHHHRHFAARERQ